MRKEKLKKVESVVKKAVKDYVNDALILAGAGIGIYATFRINATAGFYALGGVMVAMGWYLTQNPIK